jgi:hypothetical protein
MNSEMSDHWIQKAAALSAPTSSTIRIGYSADGDSSSRVKNDRGSVSTSM